MYKEVQVQREAGGRELRESPISVALSRLRSGRVLSRPILRSVSTTSSVSTWPRPASLTFCAALRMASRIISRSGRVIRADSRSSPPVIMIRAAISISPRMSRPPSSESSDGSSSRLSGSSSNSCSASAKGGRLTLELGVNVTWFTSRPFGSDQANHLINNIRHSGQTKQTTGSLQTDWSREFDGGMQSTKWRATATRTRTMDWGSPW